MRCLSPVFVVSDSCFSKFNFLFITTRFSASTVLFGAQALPSRFFRCLLFEGRTDEAFI